MASVTSNLRLLNTSFHNTTLRVVDETTDRTTLFIVTRFDEHFELCGKFVDSTKEQVLKNLFQVSYQVRPACWIPILALISREVTTGKQPINISMLPTSQSTVDMEDIFASLRKSWSGLYPHFEPSTERRIRVLSPMLPVFNITTAVEDVWMPTDLHIMKFTTRIPRKGRHVNFVCADEDQESRRAYIHFVSTLANSTKWAVDTSRLFFFRVDNDSTASLGVTVQLHVLIACPGFYGAALGQPTCHIQETTDSAQQTDFDLCHPLSKHDLDADFGMYSKQLGWPVMPLEKVKEVFQCYVAGKAQATSASASSSASSSSSSNNTGQIKHKAGRAHDCEEGEREGNSYDNEVQPPSTKKTKTIEVIELD